MAQQQVKVQFDAFGNSKIDAIGFVGKQCETATAYIQNALSGTATKDEKKPEYFQGAATGQTVGQRF